MTRERAAELLSEVMVLDDPEMAEAHRVAISALRQQEHFREATKKVDPLTNAQKIRAMSDEELAGFLLKLMGNLQCFGEGMFPYHPCPQDQNCKQCGLEWLQMPAEEDKHEP